ncbi:MAG: hypothetical protein H6722_20230 [Sandaracinus sp.]|nr:hypothetical protein [Sandaracinus sp.]
MATRAHGSIWLYAFLYFACYAPYTALTKALSSGMIGDPIAGPSLLPLSSMASLVVVALFLGGTGWWRFATQRKLGRRSIPVPTRWTALSGLCSAVILTTTTLAYTFEGVSIVFVMLLMRGGVLVIAPIVDALSGAKDEVVLVGRPRLQLPRADRGLRRAQRLRHVGRGGRRRRPLLARVLHSAAVHVAASPNRTTPIRPNATSPKSSS